MSGTNTAASGTGELSMSEAFAIWTAPPKDEQNTQTVEAGELPAVEESALADSGPDNDPLPAEETESDADREENLPPIDPPRSWSKEDKEAFKALPREAQERISERERARDADIRKRQDEIANERKALEAQRNEASQLRSQYENALPNLINALQNQMAGEFADIKSVDDVARLAEEDPLRFLKFQGQRERLMAAQREHQANVERQKAEAFDNFKRFADEEDRKFVESVPELAKPEEFKRVTESAKKVLNEIGFTDDELGAIWSGQRGISLRDSRMQRLILDATRYRTAKATVTAAPKPVAASPTLKPAVSRDKASVSEDRIRELNAKLDRTGSVRDAFELWKAQSRRA